MTKQARTSEQLRELVLQAGLELLNRDGLILVSDSISYAKVFRYLDEQYSIQVTRGSVHERIWQSHDDFRREVLAEAISLFPVLLADPSNEEYETLFQRAADMDGGLSERLTMVAQWVGPRILGRTLGSPSFRRLQSAKAIAFRFNDRAATPSLQERFERSAASLTIARRTRFAAALPRFGARPMAALGLSSDETSDLLHTLRQALFEGAQVVHRTNRWDLASPTTFTSGDPDEPWLVASIGLRCQLLFLLEHNPEQSLAIDPQLQPALAEAEPADVLLHPQASRRSRQQLRRLVLAAAVELVERDGLRLRPTSLRYADVFAHIKQQHGITVYRASVHNRLWASQEEFQLEVLARGVSARPSTAVAETLVTSLAAEPADRSTEPKPVVLDFIRRFADAQLRTLETSPESRTRLLIEAALQTEETSAAVEAVRLAVDEAAQEHIEQFKKQFRINVLDFGFEAKPELGLNPNDALEIVEVLATATATGIFFNHLAGVESASRRYRISRQDGSGEYDDWSALGLALRCYFEQLYQPRSER